MGALRGLWNSFFLHVSVVKTIFHFYYIYTTSLHNILDTHCRKEYYNRPFWGALQEKRFILIYVVKHIFVIFILNLLQFVFFVFCRHIEEKDILSLALNQRYFAIFVSKLLLFVLLTFNRYTKNNVSNCKDVASKTCYEELIAQKLIRFNNYLN